MNSHYASTARPVEANSVDRTPAGFSLDGAMNKAALVAEVQKLMSGGTSRAAAERATDAVLAALKRGLRRDKEVSLVGFGTFIYTVRPARNGFNPHTKQPMKIGAVKTIRFRPGSDLRAL